MATLTLEDFLKRGVRGITPQPARPPTQPVTPTEPLARPTVPKFPTRGAGGEILTPEMFRGDISRVELEDEGGFFSNLRDSFRLGATQMAHRTKQYFQSVLPEQMFGDFQADIKTTQAEGLLEQGRIDQATFQQLQVNAETLRQTNTAARETFKKKYIEAEQKNLEWLKEHPELQPPKVLEEGIFEAIKKDPKVLLNRAALGYIIGESLAFSIAFIGTVVAVTAATKNPYLGAVAAIGMTTPSVSQMLYEDLTQAGASEEQAAQLAIPIGVLIASIELAGAIPLLGAISKPFRDILMRQIGKEVAERTVKGLLKKGLTTFTQVEIAEIMEEVAQGAIQDATVRIFDENRSLLENIPETVVRTAIATLPFALVGAGGRVRMERGIVPEVAEPVVTPPITPTVSPVSPEIAIQPLAVPTEPLVPKPAVTPPVSPEVRPEVLDKAGSSIEGLDGKPIELNPDGTITLFHRTTSEIAERIRQTGKFETPTPAEEVFFSSFREGQAVGYGDTVVEVRLKPEKVTLDDAFLSGEVHVSVLPSDVKLAVVPEVTPEVTPEALVVEPPAEPVSLQLPEELPTTPPPITPEGETLGRTANEFTGITMADLQDAQIVADIAFRPDMARWVGNLPLMRNFNRTLNPSAIAGTPAEKYGNIRAVLRDEAIQKSQGVIAYHSELGSLEKVFGKLNEKGEIASGKLKGITVGDIAQNFKKYSGQMTEAEKQWLNRANDIENAVNDYFERNDIDIDLLALEEGGHFATRRVWAKVVEGEVLDIRYVGVGPGRPGTKTATEKRRWFKTEADAIKEGYRYLPYDQSLYLKVQGAYNRVADKQASDWLLLQVPWRTTGAPEELKMAAEAAILKKRHSQQLLSALNRAVRGERVPDATINSIARSYPDQAQILKDLIPSIQAGAPTAKIVQNLTGVAKGLVDTNKSASQRAINARARARDRALIVGFEESMIPAPAFAGKILTGVEAKETARLVTKDFSPDLNKVLASVNKANDMVRFLILAGDASPFGIQLIFLHGAHPVVAAKAMRGYIGALFDPEFLAAYKTANKDVIDRHPNMMLPEVGTAEMTETMGRGGWLAGNQTLLPQTEVYWKNVALVIPRVFGKGAGYLLLPFARAYSGAMTVAGIEMAKAMEYMGTTPERMADLDQHINVFRGMTSSARIGVTPHWQQVERASILAAMYNRAIASFLFDLGRGGIRGAEARKGLAKGISALIAMSVLISLARGEDPEEILDHFNPNSPNFFTWTIAGQRIGPGSKVRAVVKLWAQSIDNPESLLQRGMDSPAFRFVRGNLAPVISSGLDLWTGQSYIGDPTRDGLLSFSKEILAGNMLPIWVQSVLLEGGDVIGRTARGIAEFFGGRAYPEPLWNEVGRLRDKYSKTDFKIKYEELNRAQTDELRNNHPDLKDLEDKARLEGATRGDEFNRWITETREQIISRRDDALEKAATALLDGLDSNYGYDKERGYARPYYSGEMSVLWSARESLDSYSVRQIEKWMGENLKPEDRALDKYQEYRANLIAKSDIPKDWDKIEAQTNKFLSQFSRPIRDYIEANKNRWIEKLPPNAKKIELLRLEEIENQRWWRNYRNTRRVPQRAVPRQQRSLEAEAFIKEGIRGIK